MNEMPPPLPPHTPRPLLPETSPPFLPGGRRAVRRETGLAVMTLLVMIAASAVYRDSFPTAGNFSAILRNLAGDGIMAAGMAVLMIGGAFDLSVGATFSMTGIVTGWLLKAAGFPVVPAIVCGLAIATFGGLLNGVLVAKVKVNALITTLGTMQIFKGVAVLIGGPGIGFLPDSFGRLGQAEFLGLQSPVWLMIFVLVLFQFLMSRTRFFRKYYYIGGNPRAAFLSGINVQAMQIVAFMISGFLAGLAGVSFAARLSSSVSTAGDGAELRIITAVILGGASLTGGKGTIWGTFIGVVFMAIIGNIMIVAQISSYWQSIVIGCVLVLAVALDLLWNRK